MTKQQLPLISDMTSDLDDETIDQLFFISRGFVCLFVTVNNLSDTFIFQFAQIQSPHNMVWNWTQNYKNIKFYPEIDGLGKESNKIRCPNRISFFDFWFVRFFK